MPVQTGDVETGPEELDTVDTGAGGGIEHAGHAPASQCIKDEAAFVAGPVAPVDEIVPALHQGVYVFLPIVIGVANRTKIVAEPLAAAAPTEVVEQVSDGAHGTAGCSDAKLPDSQATAEATFSCQSAALSGANLIHDCGLLDHCCLASPAYMLLVNEVLYMINQFTRGIEVDEETLAVDVIHSVGPGGHFMAEEHTLKYFREVWSSTLFDRSNYESWLEQGGRRFQERLRERTLPHMEHQPAPLPPETVQALDQLARHWQ